MEIEAHDESATDDAMIAAKDSAKRRRKMATIGDLLMKHLSPARQDTMMISPVPEIRWEQADRDAIHRVGSTVRNACRRRSWRA